MRAELTRIGLRAGLSAVGFTTAEPFVGARLELESRKAAGLHATMEFTFRNPERSTTPTRILDTARTLIVGAWPYASAAPGRAVTERAVSIGAGGEAAASGPTGDVAAYAWRDHYSDLRAALGEIADHLRAHGHVARVVADDNALVDRAAAIRAGIGWSGKNSNVLIPGAGSWFVLGAVVTDAELEADEPIAEQCGGCVRCLDGCPTDAIIAPGVVDARRCLAWLVQADGPFPLEFREALGTRIYGCDDCQTVCPPSRNNTTPLRGDEITGHDLFELLSMTDDELEAAVGRWYIPRRDFDMVRRNALVALGNADLTPQQSDRALELLRRTAARSRLLADHASWAADRLGLGPL